jgi:hypothetical protein
MVRLPDPGRASSNSMQNRTSILFHFWTSTYATGLFRSLPPQISEASALIGDTVILCSSVLSLLCLNAVVFEPRLRWLSEAAVGLPNLAR